MTELKYLGTSYLPARPLDWVSVSCSWCSVPLSMSLQEDVRSSWSSTPGQLIERVVDHETLFKGRASCLWSPAAMSVPLGQNSCLPPGTIRSQAEGGMRSTSKSALNKFTHTHTHTHTHTRTHTHTHTHTHAHAHTHTHTHTHIIERGSHYTSSLFFWVSKCHPIYNTGQHAASAFLHEMPLNI